MMDGSAQMSGLHFALQAQQQAAAPAAMPAMARCMQGARTSALQRVTAGQHRHATAFRPEPQRSAAHLEHGALQQRLHLVLPQAPAVQKCAAFRLAGAQQAQQAQRNLTGDQLPPVLAKVLWLMGLGACNGAAGMGCRVCPAVWQEQRGWAAAQATPVKATAAHVAALRSTASSRQGIAESQSTPSALLRTSSRRSLSSCESLSPAGSTVTTVSVEL